MRIAFLAASALPAQGRANSIQVMSMCQAFVQNGHEVVLVAPDKPERLKRADPFAYYGVQPAFSIEWLPWLPIRGRGYIYGWLAARRARRLRPSLVYGRSIVGCYFSARFGLPTVLEMHQRVEENDRLLQFVFSGILRQPQLKRLVTISESLAQYFQASRGAAEALVQVAQSGAQDPALSGASLKLDREHLHAGYVGGLRQGKGIELLARLAPLTPWVTYHIVGGSQAEIQQWKEVLKESGNITIHGWVPPAETDKYRRSFDVLLAPYDRMAAQVDGVRAHTAWLSPLKLMEYMAAGKPILCSDLPAYREILAHERTALLCDPDDPQAWVTALKRLWEQTELRHRLGEAARREFLQRYTWKRRAANVLEGIE